MINKEVYELDYIYHSRLLPQQIEVSVCLVETSRNLNELNTSELDLKG